MVHTTSRTLTLMHGCMVHTTPKTLRLMHGCMVQGASVVAKSNVYELFNFSVMNFDCTLLRTMSEIHVKASIRVRRALAFFEGLGEGEAADANRG